MGDELVAIDRPQFVQKRLDLSPGHGSRRPARRRGHWRHR